MTPSTALFQTPLLPPVRQVARLLLQAFACLLVADFLTGLVHWWEDAYAREEWPLLGPLVAAPNLLHHRDPRAMTRQSWWRNVDVTVGLGVAVLGGAWALQMLSWQLGLVVTLAAFTNLFHRWAHQTSTENGPVVTWLQGTGLFQSRAQHALHHRWPRESHYCALTGFVNPVLERIHLWTRLERLIAFTTGLQRRQEPRPGAAA
jgi:ubiquitin-conjugating enzyme E2 variant